MHVFRYECFRRLMKNPIIFRRSDTLTPDVASYWKDLLYRVVKIGTELEVAPRKGEKRQDFEDSVRKGLSPSGRVDSLGLNGVWDVQTEHCGVELRIIGRQPHFRALQKQYEKIMSVLQNYSARPRATCGLHFHLLTPGLAEPVPEIILANIWNLVRRYAPELRFITSGGDKREALCRRRNHTSHLEMVRLSPGTMSMQEIQQTLKDSLKVPEHQNFLNIEHIDFTQDGKIFPLHLEFRFPDSHLSPTAIAGQTFLFLTLMLKAVDISQYGVIHVGKIRPWKRKIEILNMLSNNDGGLSTSNTASVTDEIIEELRQGAYEMLDLLAPAFERFEDNSALNVLYALAEKPISLMRCAGYKWEDVEACLAERITFGDRELDKIDRRLMQCIELGEWNERPSAEIWQRHAASELFLTPQELKTRLAHIEALRGLRWNSRQGTMVFKS